MIEFSYTQAITLIRNLAGIESSSTEETVAKQLYNSYNSRHLTNKTLDFNERSYAITTVASTAAYTLPRYVGRVRAVKFTSGTTLYRVDKVHSLDEWTALNSGSPTSNIPTHYILLQNAYGQTTIEMYPTPSTASLTITVYYSLLPQEMDEADYTTGTLTATNGSATIEGSGTTWTAAMVGRWIKLPDNYWYYITARTDNDTITVTPTYSGVTTAGATYVLGEKSLIPAPFAMLPIWETILDIVSARTSPNQLLVARATRNSDSLRNDMIAIHGRKYQSALVDDPKVNSIIDPNDPSQVVITA